jgi:hypothetical protein
MTMSLGLFIYIIIVHIMILDCKNNTSVITAQTAVHHLLGVSFFFSLSFTFFLNLVCRFLGKYHNLSHEHVFVCFFILLVYLTNHFC